MKSALLALCLLLINPSAHAETQLGDVVDPQSPAYEESKMKALNEVVQKSTTKISNGLRKEFDRYRVRYTLGLRGQEINGEKIGADAYYQALVEPNFRAGEQVRRDIYVLGGYMMTPVGGKIETRVTFSRVFKGKNAKIKAIMALPYFVNRVPLSAKEVKTDLEVGDTVRFEVFGSGHIGAGRGVGGSLGRSSGGNVTLAKEALFIVDLYRHSADQTRVRLFGLANRSKLGFTLQAFTFPFSESLPGFIEKHFRIGPDMNLFISKNLIKRNEFPIDTMMIDYLFNTAQPSSQQVAKADAAMDELLKNVRSFGVMPLIKLLSDQDNLSQVIRSKAGLAEQLAREDYQLGQAARVRHLFKGRIQSNMVNFSAGFKLSALFDGRSATSMMGSFIRTEDTFDQKKYYYMQSVTRHRQREMLFSRSEDSNILDFEALVQSNEKAEIGDLLDVVTTREVRDKNIKSDELAELRRNVVEPLPDVLKTPEVVNFIPKSSQRNAFFRSRFSFGLESFMILNRLSKGEIIMALYNFIENHPKRKIMDLGCHQMEFGEAGCSKTIANVAEELGSQIHQAVADEYTREERLHAFSRLMAEPVFQDYLLSEFLVQFIPDALAKKALGFSMQFTSTEIPNQEIQVGDNKVSDVYRFVSFVRSVLSNRSYDLRLETIINEDGTESLVLPELKNFGYGPDVINNR